MKTIKQPKDGKKFICNGLRFSSMDDVTSYLLLNDFFICSTEEWKGFTIVDVASLHARENMPS